MDETLTGISAKPIEIVCPVCGWESTFGNSFSIYGDEFKEYLGDYCMKCYAKWISETFPKMKFK